MANPRLKELLAKFKEKLEEENKLLKNPTNPEDIEKIVEEKRLLLADIAEFNKEDFEGLEDFLKEIDALTKKNMFLATNQMQLIEEIFEALLGEENVKQYTPYGEVESKQGGFLNKKI